jgi:hypothetical protein
MTDQEQCLESSRERFESFIAQRFFDGIFEDCKSGTFEQNLPHITKLFVRDEKSYSLRDQDFSFRDLRREWELWCAAYICGWEDR